MNADFDIPECRALGRWMQSELDVVETFKLALERLEPTADVQHAREVMAEHAAHALELRESLRTLGRVDVDKEHAHACTVERLEMFKLPTEELLPALLANERRRLAAYEAAVSSTKLPPRVAELLRQSIAAEARHIARLTR